MTAAKADRRGLAALPDIRPPPPDDGENCACGASLGDGEGYAGKCGNCADRAEAHQERPRA